MNSNRWIYVGFASVLLLIVIVLWNKIFNTGKDSDGFVNWTPEYKYDRNKEPFDVDVTRELIKSAVGEGHFETLADTGRMINVLPAGKGNTYFFIGKYYDLSKNEVSALMDFIAEGNDVFIVAEKLNRYAEEMLLADEEIYESSEHNASKLEQSFPDSFVMGPIGTFDTSLEVRWHHKLALTYRKITFIDDYTDQETPGLPYPDVLQMANDVPCFISISIGDNGGHIYLHTIPLVFSNIYMKDEHYFHHLNGLVSYINFPEVYWDNHLRTSDEEKLIRSDKMHESEFRYLISQPELKYALYLLIVGALMYVLFSAKRIQRPIPVIDSNRNMSVQSLQMVSRLFYQHPDHLELVNIKMTIFMHFVRSRYGLIISELDPEFHKRLALVSGVKHDLVRSIFVTYDQLKKKGEAKAKDSVVLSDKINRFYSYCK